MHSLVHSLTMQCRTAIICRADSYRLASHSECVSLLIVNMAISLWFSHGNSHCRHVDAKYRKKE